MDIISASGGLLFLKETHTGKKAEIKSHSDDEEETNDGVAKQPVNRTAWCCWNCVRSTTKDNYLKALKPLFRVKIIVSMFIFGMAPFVLTSSAEVIASTKVKGFAF